jgi:hypothetical protein
MSFLDNLESTLKALEAREEKDIAKIRELQEQREAERTAALQRAPHAEALKTSAFTNNLLAECRTQGRPLRVLVRFTWLGEVLRLDANEKRLELIPTAQGVDAVASVNGEETSRQLLDLATADPASVVTAWLKP